MLWQCMYALSCLNWIFWRQYLYAVTMSVCCDVCMYALSYIKFELCFDNVCMLWVCLNWIFDVSTCMLCQCLCAVPILCICRLKSPLSKDETRRDCSRVCFSKLRRWWPLEQGSKRVATAHLWVNDLFVTVCAFSSIKKYWLFLSY